MKYMLLIYSNRESWAAMTPAERDELGRAHQELTRELTDQGRLVGGAGLADPVTTRTVRIRGGVRAVTDGPYAETKEHLAGFYLIECESADEAIEYAARMPDARHVGVEVRPVMEPSGLEM